MRERAINLKAWEVNAILEGRKTQLRRKTKFPASMLDDGAEPTRCNRVDDGTWSFYVAGKGNRSLVCPYGQPGDRLWGRESIHRTPMLHLLTGEPLAAEYDVAAYTADDAPVLEENGFDLAWWYPRRTCPATHMPRWASRILLEVTDVRVERLNQISEADTIATAIDSYPTMLEYILSPRPDLWDTNPWVWAVSFKRIGESN